LNSIELVTTSKPAICFYPTTLLFMRHPALSVTFAPGIAVFAAVIVHEIPTVGFGMLHAKSVSFQGMI
jgi:hypothetical protein